MAGVIKSQRVHAVCVGVSGIEQWIMLHQHQVITRYTVMAHSFQPISHPKVASLIGQHSQHLVTSERMRVSGLMLKISKLFLFRIKPIESTAICSYPNIPSLIFRYGSDRVAMQTFRALTELTKAVESFVIQTYTAPPATNQCNTILTYA